MQTRRRELFPTIRSEGGILPADLLQRIADRDKGLEGLAPTSYHLAPGERINEATERAWSRLREAWITFQDARNSLAEGEVGTSVTRERWLLPLFQELGYGRLQTAKAVEIEGKSYAVSHAWGAVPIHLVGCGVELDRRTRGVAGAAQTNPHGLLQELLNRSHAHLWGFVSNGTRLRILRDNRSLTRQSYVEFDLESMMDGEIYSDFALLWLLCHQSRVEGERPELFWLEIWSKTAQEQGARALDQLRNGVEEAITILGKGFLTHSANRTLKASLRSGALTNQDYFRQLLRLVYQLIFLFVAEDRDWLLDPKSTQEARELYQRFYSTARLRQIAEGMRGTRHGDLYRALRLIVELLDKDEGCNELALPALGSFLFAASSTRHINDCEIANFDLLDAIRALAFTLDNNRRRPVDYKNLRSEELGSVYEALLELHPNEFSVDAGSFELQTARGSERKTTGSYYTPDSLVQCLLDTALDPVLDTAARKPDPERAILDLKICDPACGSGHFLIAAAHRVAKRLASVRTGDEEPSPEATRSAIRDVIGHCLYGVDLNPMVVELCKFAFLMEAMEPGKPLLFLDRQIRCGNSLLGTTPVLLLQGIPDSAFEPIEGDVKAVSAEFKKKNREQRTGQEALFDENLMPWEELGNLAASMVRMDRMPIDHIGQIRKQEGEFADHVHSQNYENNKLWADAWCAAFVWKKQRAEIPPCFPLTDEYFRRIRRNPYSIEPWMREEIKQLAERYQFFHWHLEFPTVCRWPGKGEDPNNTQTGWSGGFDVVLGNPPWERVKLQEKEWFAVRRPDIANSLNASTRRRQIESLEQEDPALWNQFFTERRQAEGESHLIRQSGRYPLCGRGDVNTYAIFAETNRMLLGPSGRAGFIIQSDIVTGDTYKDFFRTIIEAGQLVSFYDFVNTEGLFPHVHRTHPHFCLITISTKPAGKPTDFAFWNTNVGHLLEQERHFILSAEDIALLNPNTRTCPIFRSRRDAEITKAIYRRVPVMIVEGPQDRNPWNIEFKRMVDMANDSYLFRTARQLETEGYEREGNNYISAYDRYLPLYEAKMLHQFDHRWATYASDTDSREVKDVEKKQPGFVVQPRYWIREEVVESAIPKYPEVVHRAMLSGHLASLKRALFLWVAGFYLNHNDPDAARDIIERALSLPLERSLNGVLLVNDVSTFAAKMDQLFPLMRADVEAIQSEEDDHTEVAQELVQRFRPRWLIGWRDITNTTNERTVIGCLAPRAAIGNKVPLTFMAGAASLSIVCFLADLNTFILDYAARQKMGGTTLNYFYFKQLPILAPDAFTAVTSFKTVQPTNWQSWIAPRVLELIYTAWDMQPFARDCGYDGPPFAWDAERRFLVRCELDAAYFHLYGVERSDVDYILDTFPIVKRKDKRDFGSYRTKETILSLYDAMASARITGQPYQSPLNPAPGTHR